MAQEKNVDAAKEVFIIEDPSNLMELALKASLKFSVAKICEIDCQIEICWCGKDSKSVLLQVRAHLKEVILIFILKFNASHISLKSLHPIVQITRAS